jgi:adenine phosphoribosyltransferase
MQATIELVRKMGGEVIGAVALVELTFLEGRKRIDTDIHTLVAYDS